MFQYKVLYSKQKTKKRPTYLDGKLSIQAENKKASLYDEDGKFLESTYLSNVSNLEKLEDFETSCYLIQIDELIKKSDVLPVEKPKLLEKTKESLPPEKTFQSVHKAFKLPTKTVVPKEGRDENSLLNELISNKPLEIKLEKKKEEKVEKKPELDSIFDLDDELLLDIESPKQETKIFHEKETPKSNLQIEEKFFDQDSPVKANNDLSPVENSPPKSKLMIINDDIDDSFFDDFDGIKDKNASESVIKEQTKTRLLENKDKPKKSIIEKKNEIESIQKKDLKVSINSIVNTVNKSFQTIIFPDSEACKSYEQGKNKLKREVIIPDKFKTISSYSNTFLDALYEQINLEMFELALKYREIYKQITKFEGDDICPNHKDIKCKYVRDGYQCTKCKFKNSKFLILNPKQRESHFRSLGIPYYTQCEIFQSKNNTDNSLFLKIDREKENVYAKDDVWIICPDPEFNQDIMICKSLFHGPNATGLIQLKLLYGKFKKYKNVEAIRGANLTTNFEMIDNLKTINGSKLPLLYQFLGNDKPELNELKLKLSNDQIHEICEKLIQKYNLNQDQKNVLYECEKWFNGDKSEKSILLIHGIFGSGKSFLLVVLIVFISELLDFVKDKETRILISSVTNVAVDNILNGLLNLGFTNFARVGSQKKISKSILPFTATTIEKSNKELLKDYKEMLRDPLDEEETKSIKKIISDIEKGLFEDRKNSINQYRVIGVTAAATSFPILKDSKFSILILDESSQCLEPLALLPISRFQCKKLILCGDPLQLPPTLPGNSDDPKNSIEKTIFIRLANVGFQTLMLHTQYRCHPIISSLSNHLFYQGKIKNGISEKDRESLVSGLPPIVIIDTEGKEKFSVSSIYNSEEIKVVLKLVNMLIEYGIEESSIGVISLYHLQTYKLNQELKRFKGIKVSTVDAFQGGEKEIIILSCVRSQSLEFIESEKRLNVAISRAKRHLIIVCNQFYLEKGKFYNYIFEKAKNLKNGILHNKQIMKEKNFDFLQIKDQNNDQEDLLNEMDHLHDDIDLSSIYKRKYEEDEEESNKIQKLNE